MAEAGAAHVLDQRELSGARLAGDIISLCSDAAARARMAAEARLRARPDAARAIVTRILELAAS
jgi:UDP-N-acetylglucosamine:LPS N-acetylglucosamine transferase